jgi:hypothetical protein
MQSSCLFKAGTSRPCSSAAGQGFESIFSITVAIGWVVRREDQERFVIVSYSMMFPRWHWLSIAYPAIPQVESEPVQVPIAIGSAVCHTCVIWCVEGYRNSENVHIQIQDCGVRESVGASAVLPCARLAAQMSRREHQT